MIDGHRGVVKQPPASTLNGKTDGHIIISFRAGATHPGVEPDRANCGKAVRTICPLQNIHIPGRANAKMMIAHDPAEPRDPANSFFLDGRHLVIALNPVPATDTARLRIFREMGVNSRKPVRAGRGVVIRYGNNLSIAAGKTGILCVDMPRGVDFNNINR